VRRLLVLLSVVAMLAGGCGGGAHHAAQRPIATGPPLRKQAYELEMQRLGTRVATSIQQIGQLIVGGRSVAAKPRVIEIVAPTTIKGPHELLTEGVREYADELAGVIADVSSGDTARALALIPTLKGIRDMTRASRAIENAGFDIRV
jgi:hypothetical protein